MTSVTAARCLIGSFAKPQMDLIMGRVGVNPAAVARIDKVWPCMRPAQSALPAAVSAAAAIG